MTAASSWRRLYWLHHYSFELLKTLLTEPQQIWPAKDLTDGATAALSGHWLYWLSHSSFEWPTLLTEPQQLWVANFTDWATAALSGQLYWQSHSSFEWPTLLTEPQQLWVANFTDWATAALSGQLYWLSHSSFEQSTLLTEPQQFWATKDFTNWAAVAFSMAHRPCGGFCRRDSLADRCHVDHHQDLGWTSEKENGTNPHCAFWKKTNINWRGLTICVPASSTAMSKLIPLHTSSSVPASPIVYQSCCVPASPIAYQSCCVPASPIAYQFQCPR